MFNFIFDEDIVIITKPLPHYSDEPQFKTAPESNTRQNIQQMLSTYKGRIVWF